MMKNELTRRSLLDLGTTSPYPTLDMVITTNVKRSINVSRREFTISRREGSLSLPPLLLSAISQPYFQYQ